MLSDLTTRPSLFIGAANTSSALHIDSGATNFWMYLMTGRKKWRFWDREQVRDGTIPSTSRHVCMVASPNMKWRDMAQPPNERSIRCAGPSSHP
jgi:hypothetical protein